MTRHVCLIMNAAIAMVGGASGVGCTAESTRVAIESQQRADAVTSAVVERQHEALRVLLYRDAIRRIEADDDTLSERQRAALGEAWNDRDLIEFWRVQYERAKALRLVGVDAKLYSDQAIVDLLIKSAEAKFDRGKQAFVASLAESGNVEPVRSKKAEE